METMTRNWEKIMTGSYLCACLSIHLLLAAVRVMVPGSARAYFGIWLGRESIGANLIRDLLKDRGK